MTRSRASATATPRRTAYRRGRGAELRAAWYLRAKGYRIVARGFRCAVGEIDLIARKSGVLVAVEVKARADQTAAAEAIGARQRRRINRAMSDFIARRRDFSGDDIRFDAILVSPWRVPRHIVDAWRPDAAD